MIELPVTLTDDEGNEFTVNEGDVVEMSGRHFQVLGVKKQEMPLGHNDQLLFEGRHIAKRTGKPDKRYVGTQTRYAVTVNGIVMRADEFMAGETP